MVMDFDPGFSFNVQGDGDAAHPWEFRGATHMLPYHRNLQLGIFAYFRAAAAQGSAAGRRLGG